MKRSLLTLLAVACLGACTSSNTAHAVYDQSPVCATDVKQDVVIVNRTPTFQPPDQQPCNASVAGGEMFDRERGFISPIEGGAIVVSDIVDGWTTFR